MQSLWRVRAGRSTGQRSLRGSWPLATLAFALVSFGAFSATGERLPIRAYTTEQGLAHAHVRRIVRDPRGFLWFCTVDGLSRFDGAEFVTYRVEDGLPDHAVNDLLVTRNGAYWIATNGGVARFDPLAPLGAEGDRRSTDSRSGRLFRNVLFEGSPTRREIRVLTEDRAGRVWAGGQGGLFVLERSGPAGRFRHVATAPVAMVTALLAEPDGGLWIGTSGGLLLQPVSSGAFPEPSAARAGVTRVQALAFDHQGRLWVGHDAGLLVLGPGAAMTRSMSAAARRPPDCGDGPPHHRRLRLPTGADDACTVTVEDGLLDRRVRTLGVGSDGHVRVGTVTGLSDVDGTHITSFTEAHGLVDDTINSLTEDRDGNLWIGTDAGGAMRVAAFGLISYFRADGLRVDYVPFLIDGAAGRIVAVSGNYFSVNEFDGRHFVPARFDVPRSVPDDGFFCALRDHLGAWWLGTPRGLYEFPAVRHITDLARLAPVARYARHPALPSDDLFPMFEDSRGDIWLIAQLPDRVRLLRLDRVTRSFQTYGAPDGIADITVRPKIVEDRQKTIFFGFEDAGLFGYRDGRFEAVLDGGEPLRVADLYLDRLDRLWIATVDGSVGRIDNVSTHRVVRDTTVAHSLAGAHVRCVVEDTRGHFFFGTTTGVVEVDPATGGSWRYTTAEGLAQNEVRSALASRHGEVWFSTIAGVSRLETTPARGPPRRTCSSQAYA